jgi:hypothetical protein
MKAFLVAYDYRELHKKSKLKIIKYGYVRSCSKYSATQIGLLEILGVNKEHEKSLEYYSCHGNKSYE